MRICLNHDWQEDCTDGSTTISVCQKCGKAKREGKPHPRLWSQKDREAWALME